MNKEDLNLIGTIIFCELAFVFGILAMNPSKFRELGEWLIQFF